MTTRRDASYVNPDLLTLPIPSSVVDAVVGTTEFQDWQRAAEALRTAQGEARAAADAVSKAGEADRAALERHVLEGDSSKPKRTQPAAEQRLIESKERLAALSTLTERCQRKVVEAGVAAAPALVDRLAEARDEAIAAVEASLDAAQRAAAEATRLDSEQLWTRSAADDSQAQPWRGPTNSFGPNAMGHLSDGLSSARQAVDEIRVKLVERERHRVDLARWQAQYDADQAKLRAEKPAKRAYSGKPVATH
jgi:hypothetical protein